MDAMALTGMLWLREAPVPGFKCLSCMKALVTRFELEGPLPNARVGDTDSDRAICALQTLLRTGRDKFIGCFTYFIHQTKMFNEKKQKNN